MRNFLNNILLIIGAETLTDLEFGTITATVVEYSQTTYNALSGVLKSRESVSSTQERLIAYFNARGVEVTPLSTGKSNIYIGDVL